MSSRWVHIKTRLKSRPEIIGFPDEDEGPRIYFLCPMILDKEGKWVDSWTWEEKYGHLPRIFENPPWGEIIVYKWDVTEINEIDESQAPILGRCWLCGVPVEPGARMCSPEHAAVFVGMGLSDEMLPEDDDR